MHFPGAKSAAIRRWLPALLFLCAPRGAHATQHETPYQEAPSDSAYRVEVGYIGEHWSVLQGGIEQGSRYLDNLDLIFAANLEHTLDVPVTLYAHALYNNGQQVSELTGDAQGVSNIESSARALRLFEAWTEWRFGRDSRQSLRYGLYDVNSEFDVVPTAGLFIGSSHGMGREFSQSGHHGPSTFPVTSLALRHQWRIDDAWTWQTTVLDGVPGDPEHPDRTSIRLSGDDGALFLTEVSRTAPRLQKLALGVWQYTAKFDDLIAADAEGAPIRRPTNRGVYVLGDAALVPASSAQSDVPPRLSAFIRFGVANGDLNRFDRYLGAGLVLRGLVGEDELGIAIAQAYNGDAYRALAARVGMPTDRVETNIELTWRIPVAEWLALQPDVQYIINPGTDPQLRDALVVGLRFELTGERAW
jgi:porin